MTRLIHSVGIRALVFFSGSGVISLVILMAGVWDGMTRLAGVLAALFILYGFLSAKNSESVRRTEDEEALKDVRALAYQCASIVEAIAHMVEASRTIEVPGALAHLSAKTSLFVTRYRKYLDPGTAGMIVETEQMIVRAQLRGAANLPKLVNTLRLRVGDIDEGILDIDDPFLHKSRRAI